LCREHDMRVSRGGTCACFRERRAI
jgi:hypothetical protein